MKYKIAITREGDQLLADVVGLPGAHTHAENLELLRDRIYEVIALVLDSSDDQPRPMIEMTFPDGPVVDE